MKRLFLIILIIVILIITALVFDWGRRDVVAPIIDQVSTSTTVVASPIIVLYPREGQEVGSPIKISGKARGFWFFEGSFPIQLVDLNGSIIASGIATSSGEWMTEDFVDFSSEIEFVKPTSTKNVLLVLMKDNPSDNPDLDQSILIPVILK
ncbi:MAG: Gmad2 immunoglobulin-like domain-containing protein [Candidatus Paceibacterota bacterium]|jgi:hypothetical protein